MIYVDKLSYEFPDKELYKNITFTIADGEHVGFIGSNGTGKTTLVDMIMNRDKYLYDGKITLEGVERIGYVSQFAVHDKEDTKTVYEFLCEDFEKMLKVQEELCARMATEEDLTDVYDEYQKALDEFDAVDGNNYESNIKKELKTAGLESIADISINLISGGEYKLVQVIKAMMKRTDFLIMDEPDVFLDFDNLNGLRELINGYEGTMLVITHNRFLLNHCFNKILHLENTDIQEYEGNYEDYKLALLVAKVEQSKKALEFEEEIERQEKLVEKIRNEATYIDNSGKGRSLKARVSYLERLKARSIKAPFVKLAVPEFSLPDVSVSENEPVITVNDYEIAYENTLLSGVSFEILAGEKVAIVGPNGTGKTTLLHDIHRNSNNAIKIHTESVGFLSQVYDENMKESTLSGGEKNVLQIEKLCNGSDELLLLDEPTSHLDVYSQEALEKALIAYKGTVLMVSHDFYTIANTVDYVLLVEDKTIRRMSKRAFRKKIYADYFDKDYIEKEDKKKELELNIEKALAAGDIEKAEKYCENIYT